MDVKNRENIPHLTRQGFALASPWRASLVVRIFPEFDTSTFLALLCPFAIFEP